MTRVKSIADNVGMIVNDSTARRYSRPNRPTIYRLHERRIDIRVVGDLRHNRIAVVLPFATNKGMDVLTLLLKYARASCFIDNERDILQDEPVDVSNYTSTLLA